MHGGRPQRSTNHTGYVSPWTPKAYTKGLQAISLANLSDNTFTGGMLAVFFWTLFSPYPRSMRSQKLTHKSFSIISVKTSLLTLWLGHSKKESLSNHGWLPQSHGLTVGVAFVFLVLQKLLVDLIELTRLVSILSPFRVLGNNIGSQRLANQGSYASNLLTARRCVLGPNSLGTVHRCLLLFHLGLLGVLGCSLCTGDALSSIPCGFIRDLLQWRGTRDLFQNGQDLLTEPTCWTTQYVRVLLT